MTEPIVLTRAEVERIRDYPRDFITDSANEDGMKVRDLANTALAEMDTVARVEDEHAHDLWASCGCLAGGGGHDPKSSECPLPSGGER